MTGSPGSNAQQASLHYFAAAGSQLHDNSTVGQLTSNGLLVDMVLQFKKAVLV